MLKNPFKNCPQVRLLLEAGADPNARDVIGRTALVLAEDHGKRQVLGLLKK
jgi:ankyrin repeat protein